MKQRITGVEVGVDDVVEVVFLDHTEDSDHLIEFYAVGRVTSISKDHLTLESWGYQYDEVEASDPNVKRFSLVRKAIVNVTNYTS